MRNQLRAASLRTPHSTFHIYLMGLTNFLFQPGDRVFSSVLENQHTIATNGGRLLQLKVSNTGPTQFIQLHDKAGAVVNGDVPLYVFPIPAMGTAFLSEIGFVNGIVVCNSTTAATATLGGANCWFYAEEK